MAPEAQTNGPEEGMQLHGVYFSLVPNLFQLIKWIGSPKKETASYIDSH